MPDYGDVYVQLPGSNKWVEARLLDFTTIPIKWEDDKGDYLEHKTIVYGIVELKETGDFMARQLVQINRNKQ